MNDRTSSGTTKPKTAFVSAVESFNDSRLTNFRRTLVRNGYEVLSLVPGSPDIRSSDAVITLGISSTGNAITALTKAAGRIWFLLKSFLHLLSERPRIVIAYEPDSWILCLVYAKTMNARAVCDLHELFYTRFDESELLGSVANAQKAKEVMAWILSHFDLIYHVSEHRKRTWCISHPNQIVIGNYPPLCTQTPPASHHDPRLLRLIQGGSFRTDYGSGEIVEALFEIYKEGRIRVELDVYGGVSSVPSSMQDPMQFLIAKNILRIHGRVTRDALHTEYQKADIGIAIVQPLNDNYTVAVQRKIYEYFSSGLPVLMTAAPDMRVFYEELGCAWATDCTVASIKSSLYHLALLENLDSSGQIAYEAHLEAYNWEAVEDLLLESISG